MNKRVGRYTLVEENAEYLSVFELECFGEKSFNQPLSVIDSFTTGYNDENHLKSSLATSFTHIEPKEDTNFYITYNHEGPKKIPVVYSDEAFLRKLARTHLDKTKIEAPGTLGLIYTHILPFLDETQNNSLLIRTLKSARDLKYGGHTPNSSYDEFARHYNGYKQIRDCIVSMHSEQPNLSKTELSDFIKETPIPPIRVTSCEVKTKLKQKRLF